MIRRMIALVTLGMLMSTGAEVAAATRTVSLQWDPVADARVHHYELHYGTTAGRYERTLSTSDSQASVELPEDGATYYFAARACDEQAANCSDFSNEIAAKPALSAAFMASTLSGTVPLTVAFTDETAGAVKTRSWSFGDGVTSEASTAVHTFIVPGTYTVALTVTGAAGTSTETKAGYIEVRPRPDQSPDTGDIPTPEEPSPPPKAETPDPEIADLADAIEVGDLKLNHEWQRVNFKRRFNDPVVVAGGLSYLGQDPAVIRIRDIDSDGFSVRIQEWDYLDTWHTVEHASYIAVERGTYQLPDGIRVEAGSVTTDATMAFQFQELTAGFEKPPVVLASINSMNGVQAVTHRLRDITKNGFFVTMAEEEMNDQFHLKERIDYIAWQASSGEIGDLRFEVGIASQTLTNALATLSFASKPASTPSFLAAMQTTNGTDPAALRVPNVTKTSATLFVEEERSRDAETDHLPESLGYFVLEPIR